MKDITEGFSLLHLKYVHSNFAIILLKKSNVRFYEELIHLWLFALL